MPKKVIFILVLILGAGWMATAQPRVRASLDTTRMLIGDHNRLTLEARFRPGISIQSFGLGALDSLDKIDIIDLGKVDTLPSSDEIYLQQQMTFTVFDSGACYIPPIVISYERNGQLATTSTNTLLVEVTTPQLDSLAISPIKNIRHEPRNWEDFLPLLIVLAIVGSLIAGIYFYRKNRSENKVLPPPPPPLPAHVIALQKLDELQKAQLWQQGEVKAYHSQLSYIVREYLENRYDIQALESTTDEILAQLKNSSIGEDHQQQLRELLQLADLVKFAKAEPSEELHQKLLDNSRHFVEQSKYIPQPQPDQVAENAALIWLPLAMEWWATDVRFAHPWMFLLLALLPIIGFWYWKNFRRRYASLKVSSLKGLENVRSLRGQARKLLPLLRMLSFIAFVVAIARPQQVLQEEEIKADGIDIMLVMDLSSSMLAQDFKPDRLAVSKKVAADFVDKRPYDRIGLAVFAGEAFTQTPLTTDHRVLKEFLEGLQCGMLEDGTAIGMGLATAVNRLKESKAKSKVVILLTDGDNNAGYIKPITAAEIAREFNVRVYTIGVGSRGKALAPVSRRSDGRYIFGLATVQIDEELLRKIAQMTSGQYFRATSAEALQKIYDEIDRMEKTEIEVTVIRRNIEKYHVFATWGLLFLLIELLLRYSWLRTIP